MSPWIRRFSRFLLLGAGSVQVTGACSGDAPGPGPQSSSATHFLEDCGGACPAGLECVCSVCTRPCSVDGDCTSLNAAATCVATSASRGSCENPPAQACDVACRVDGDCRGFATADRCVSGFCRSGGAADASAAGAPGRDAASSDAPRGDGGSRSSTGGAGGGASRNDAGPTMPMDAGGATATSGGASGDAGPSPEGAPPGTGPALPAVSGTCPILKTGSNAVVLNGKTMNWTAWVGANQPSGSGGPVVIYFSSKANDAAGAREATTALTQPVVQEIETLGGLVAAAEVTSQTGSPTGGWYTGDLAYADQVVACAAAQQNIDRRRIYAAGYYFGGYESVYMWAARSAYVASVVAYSAGLFSGINDAPLESRSQIPPALIVHGDTGKDDPSYQASATWATAVHDAGGFAVNCNDGATTTDLVTRFAIAPYAWTFLKAHPYGVQPEPYTMLPPNWPTYCLIR